MSRWSNMLFITHWWQYYNVVHGNQLVQAWNKLQGVAHYLHACWYTSLFESGLSYHKIYQWSMIIISCVVAWWFCGSLSCNYEDTSIADYTNANRRESLLKGNSNIFCSGLFQRHFSHSYCKQEKKPMLPYNRENGCCYQDVLFMNDWGLLLFGNGVYAHKICRDVWYCLCLFKAWKFDGNELRWI